MELQATLVNSRIDDLRRTSDELHAGSTGSKAPSDTPITAIRRGLGVRLIALGLALALPSMRGKAGSSVRLA